MNEQRTTRTGNMLSDAIARYEWDAENRLVAVTSSPMGRVEFSYDGFSRRVRIIEKAPETMVVEADKRLVWEGLSIVYQKNITTQEERWYYGNGEQRTTGAEYILYTRDHLGSIRELIDRDTGTLLARYDYTPYGIRTKLAGGLDSDFGYTGHYTNDKTGLVLAPYRAYSPLLGRWISRDPIEEDGGLNLYGYVRGMPLSKTDRLGLADEYGPWRSDTAESLRHPDHWWPPKPYREPPPETRWYPTRNTWVRGCAVWMLKEKI